MDLYDLLKPGHAVLLPDHTKQSTHHLLPIRLKLEYTIQM